MVDLNFHKRSAYNLLKQNELTHVNLKALKDIIISQGFVIVEYGRSVNDIQVETLLKALKLKEYSSRVKAFTYCDDENRIVFILEGLSDSEQMALLSHEEGHIYCGHFEIPSRSVGGDILDEQQANEFAYNLTHVSFLNKLRLFAGIHKVKIILFLLLAMFITVCAVGTLKYTYHGTDTAYYVTENGTRYHRANCYFVAGKKNVRKVTKKEIEEGGYQPCKICQPDKN